MVTMLACTAPPPVSSFEHTVAVHGYTAPTRWALMLALPSLVGLFHQQRLDSTEHAPDAVVPVVPQQLGSQHCESLFSTWRSVSGQNTGSVTEALAKADTAIIFADMEAAASFTLRALRKAAKHKQHPTAAYTETVEDIDINRSIHQRYLMCRDVLTDLGYQGILKAHANLQSAVQDILRLTVFQRDPEQTVGNFFFCVGQIRQIRAAMRAGRKSQN
jgi:hypothetical protein